MNGIPVRFDLHETHRPQPTKGYTALISRQRTSRRLAVGMAVGMALKSFVPANLSYLGHGWTASHGLQRGG
jgi:hypothetical protein